MQSPSDTYLRLVDLLVIAFATPQFGATYHAAAKIEGKAPNAAPKPWAFGKYVCWR
jgi:hypothetical protein